LCDFRVRGIEALELFDIAGEHARLVERAVVGERMLVTPCRCEDTRAEDRRSEKHSLVPHIHIVGPGKRETGPCARVIPGRKDRQGKAKLDLVDALDAEDAGDFPDVSENVFELAAVDDFEAGFDAGILAVGPAFEAADVGTGAADHRGDFGE